MKPTVKGNHSSPPTAWLGKVYLQL